MATNYYYKEVADEVDPEKKIPIRIDTMFMPKLRAGEDIPEEDRTKYVDTGRDLAGFFEKYDPEKYVRSCDSLKEASNYHLGADAGKELTDVYNVKGDLGKGAVIGTVNINGDRGDVTFQIPAEYQNRVMYWSFYFKNLEACSGGGFTKPGQKEVTGWAVSHYKNTFQFEMQLHEVELVEGIFENDLAAKYAAPKDIKLPWWKIAAFTPKGLYSGISGILNQRDIEGAPYYGVAYKWYWGQKGDDNHYSGIVEETKPVGQLTYKVWGFEDQGGRAMVGIVGPIPDPPEEEIKEVT